MCQSCAAFRVDDLLYVDEPFNLLLSARDASGAARSGVGPEGFHVSFGPQHARKVHTGDTILDSKWQQATAETPELRDAPLFRLERLEWTQDGAAVCIQLGLTSVKEYFGSNRLPLPMRQIRRQDGERKENDINAHMANPLGCEVLLVTSDQKAVLLWCKGDNILYPARFLSRSEGRFNGPSARPEPERAGVDGAAEAPAEAQRAIALELFDASLRAVQEAVGIPREQLSAPRFIGCMSDSRHYKPELLFLTHTSLDAAGVRASYSAREGVDPEALDFWPMDSLSDCPMLVTCVVRSMAECVALMADMAPVWKEHELPAPAAARPQAAQHREERPKVGPGQTWLVVGGAERGIVVRQGCDKKSPELQRLAHGSKVEELERVGERLRYKKIEGEGPDTGWVSLAVAGKELLVHA